MLPCAQDVQLYDDKQTLQRVENVIKRNEICYTKVIETDSNFKMNRIGKIIWFSLFFFFIYLYSTISHEGDVNIGEVEMTIAIFTETEVTNYFSKIAPSLVIIQKNKTKNLRLRNINKSGCHFENWNPPLP